MTAYRGTRDKHGVIQVLVVSDERTPAESLPLSVAPLRHRSRHSPDGFEWGYGGSGPSDLALSILWDHLGVEPSRDLYLDYKNEVIALLPRDRWEIYSAEIDRWICDRQGIVK
jgi:hypothetical protein